MGTVVPGSKRWEQASGTGPCGPANLWRHSGVSIAHAVAGGSYNWIMLGPFFLLYSCQQHVTHLFHSVMSQKRLQIWISAYPLSLTTSSRPSCLHLFLATSQLSHDAADNSCQYFGLKKLYEDRQAVPKCIRKQFIKVYFQWHKLWKMSITQFLRGMRWMQVLRVWDLSQKSHLDRWSTWLSSHVEP